MPSEKVPFYDPVPPTYDEALASSSNGRRGAGWRGARSTADEAESQGLLAQSSHAAGSSRRPQGYRPPTVETDDEDSLWDSESNADSDEAAQIREEMQETEVEEPDQARNSIWSKTIGFPGFSLSLPQWKWSWRPRLPRLRIQLPSRPAATDDDDNSSGDSEGTTPTRTWQWPKMDRMTVFLTFARLLALVVILGFFYFLFTSGLFGDFSSQIMRFNPEDIRMHFQNSVDPRRLHASVQHYSSYAHIAGTEGDFATAMDMETMFLRAGLEDVQTDQFQVYLNYPRQDGRAVQVMSEDGKKATWSAKLDEDEVGGETSGHQTYVFHGYSKSGDVKGPLIYANYGSRQDFQSLKDHNIDTKGAIALVRYYGTQPDSALKVKAAELAGFAGCLIYSDPSDDGFVKGDVAPHGRYMPGDGVHRDSVGLTNWVVGDVMTPGWGSKEDALRMNISDVQALGQIPSLPLAWRDAQVLLSHLQGHGEKVPDTWKGGDPGVKELWTGNLSSPIVRLKNEQNEDERKTIWNVYGRIRGSEQGHKKIILGNHRDAWAFGAVDPHAGTAVMIEIARIFGELVARGWRPLRTIEFLSWDAAEYNLIGSTEHVEEYLDDLRDNAVAYINLDNAVYGSEMHASGSPLLEKTLLHALNRVTDPNFNVSLLELWQRREAKLEGLGQSGDYLAFQDIAGTSSMDLQFKGPKYPHRSSYENRQLVESVIDPGFVYHSLMTQVVGLILLELSDRFIVPFEMDSYAERLKHWVDDLEKWAIKRLKQDKVKSKPNFKDLKDAVRDVKKKAERFTEWEQAWDRAVVASGGWESEEVRIARMDYNEKMALFETALLDQEFGGGIPNRTQFKHVVHGPQLWAEHDEAFFPAIRDAIEAKEWKLAKDILAKTATILHSAASVLDLEQDKESS